VGVVGKSVEDVVPAMKALPPPSTAIPALVSVPPPPRYVRYTMPVLPPCGFSFRIKIFCAPFSVLCFTPAVTGRSDEVVEPVR
jgi:hypothetical protein